MANSRGAALAVLAAGSLLASACLVKDTSQTWYLEPDGQVTWMVQETDVRSDAQASLDRLNEETSYIDAVRRQDHHIARAFRELGFTGIRTRILRVRVPFTVVTDANTGRIDALGSNLILCSRLSGTSLLQRDGDAWQWTMTVRDPHAGEPLKASDDLTELLASFDTIKVVLSAGRFERAEGFTLSRDRRVASVINLDEQAAAHADDDPVITFRLRWK